MLLASLEVDVMVVVTTEEEAVAGPTGEGATLLEAGDADWEDEKTEAGKVVCKEDGYVARALDKTETALLDEVTAPAGQLLTVGSQDVMVSVVVVSTVMAGTTTGMSVVEAASPGKTR